METVRTARTPGVFIEALKYIVEQCENSHGTLDAKEVLPVWAFQHELWSGLHLFEAEDVEAVTAAIFDMGVITLVGERANNYNVQVHPDRARKILNTIAEWQ